MKRLKNVSMEQLHEQLTKTEGNVPTQRVLAAIGRKQGDTILTLARRHDVCQKTVRNWLDRFATQPLEQAPYDASRPGLEPRLSDSQRKQLFEELNRPPQACGYENVTWTQSLLERHLQINYDTVYCRRHVRRLLKEAEDATVILESVEQ